MIMKFWKCLHDLVFYAYHAGYKAGQLGENIVDSFADWWNDLLDR